MKEVQDFLSSSEQKFLPLNNNYNRNIVFSTEDFIYQNHIQNENFDKYFNIFSRHDSYKDNPDKITSEIFVVPPSEIRC